MKKLHFAFAFIMCAMITHAQTKKYNEPFRPQIHFSPAKGWMNDPNGMVYDNGIYHLFYQYNPFASVWGNLSWGHATSTDLVHWKDQPVALRPDSLGFIFSGSAVVDKNNTSGFGKNGKASLVAIYTSHDMKGEKDGKEDFQRQFIAYSTDDGKTWIKYKGNPVLPNQGVRDFRDPKVIWYEQGKQWIMILAEKDHVTFYSSPNLKNWTRESTFGETLGAHGGVWECPDLFTLKNNGKEVWVVTVSINPGAPNDGSGTQYFTGSFDGKTFTPDETETRWMDYGTDNYAGVTWSNTGSRRISLGWMSNWNYANVVPTTAWRSANTVPRDLSLKEVNGKLYLASMPVPELNKIAVPFKTSADVKAGNYTIPGTEALTSPYRITLTTDAVSDLSLAFSNASGEKLIAGYDKAKNEYFIDRSDAGKSDFNKDFAGKHIAPRLSDAKNIKLTIIIDKASIEMFADDGLSVMTDIFFPKTLLNKVQVSSADNAVIRSLKIEKLNSIWK